MVTRFSSFVRCILYIYSFSAFLCLHAHEARETTESYHLHHTHTVQVSSLIPSSTCTASTKGLTLSLSLSLKSSWSSLRYISIFTPIVFAVVPPTKQKTREEKNWDITIHSFKIWQNNTRSQNCTLH